MEQMVQALSRSFTSERLVFKPIESSEAHHEFLSRTLRSDPVHCGLSNFCTLKPLNRRDGDAINEWIMKNSLIAVVIALKEQPDTLIGKLHLTRPEGNRATSIGINIASAFQGKGYGREAIYWALEYAFAYANLHRVVMEAFAFNERAVSLYKSMGFVEEGRQRECYFSNMEWHDVVMMSMLDKEYAAIRKSRTEAAQ